MPKNQGSPMNLTLLMSTNPVAASGEGASEPDVMLVICLNGKAEKPDDTWTQIPALTPHIMGKYTLQQPGSQPVPVQSDGVAVFRKKP